jgi:hypothetical protein
MVTMAATQVTLSKGRAQNLLQEYFIRKLLFPKVYLDVEFMGVHVDVLAVDRSGTGDVHEARIVYLGKDPENAVELVIANVRSTPPAKGMPHFVYAVVVSDGLEGGRFVPSEHTLQYSFADDGVGRVGILFVDLAGNDPSPKIVVKAERFRSSKEIVALTDKFVAEHTPNWEARD